MKLNEIIPTDKIYDDLLSPSMKQIGSMFENIIKVSRFIIAPIDYGAAYQDRWQRYLTKIAVKVEEKNRIEANPEIIIPLIENLSIYTENTLLSELYLNLLASSIDRTKQEFVHPAFPTIIRQLSHDEAVILYFLKNQYKYFTLT